MGPVLIINEARPHRIEACRTDDLTTDIYGIWRALGVLRRHRKERATPGIRRNVDRVLPLDVTESEPLARPVLVTCGRLLQSNKRPRRRLERDDPAAKAFRS